MTTPDFEHQAAEQFLRRRTGAWTSAQEAEFESLLTNPEFAGAYRRVEDSWKALGMKAHDPEMMNMREQTFARVRRSNARRWRSVRGKVVWRVAMAASLAFVGFIAFQLSPFRYEPGIVQTAVGEQRTVELEDGSRVAIDALTRMRVRFSTHARVIELLEGQAQFTVAGDPARPFKVVAGGRSVVALGTVFTVEYIGRQLRVATMEGKVAVVPESTSAPIALTAGEGLLVQTDGTSVAMEKVDIAAAAAWREGKVIFHGEPLSEAVQRLNRYSRQQIEVVDEGRAGQAVSGVFAAGDARAFVDVVDADMPGAVRLRDR